MKRPVPIACWVMCCWLVGLTGAAPVVIEFAGVDASADPVQVSLVDPATSERAWVRLGGRFAGCEVQAYDAKRQVLRLGRNGETWEVRLNTGVIASTLSETERTEIARQVSNNLRMLASAADQYFLEHGVSTAPFEKLVGLGQDRYIRELAPADGEDYTKLDLTRKPEPTEWVIVTTRGVEVRYQRD